MKISIAGRQLICVKAGISSAVWSFWRMSNLRHCNDIASYVILASVPLLSLALPYILGTKLRIQGAKMHFSLRAAIR